MPMDNKNLEQTLKLLLDHLDKLGVIRGVNKNDLVHQVMESILSVRKDGIRPEELLDKTFQKTLILSLTSQHLNNKQLPGLELKYTDLFKFNKHDLTGKDKDDAEHELKNVFKILLDKINKLTPDPKNKLSDKQLDELAGFMAKKSLNTYLKQGNQRTMGQSNTLLNMMLTLTLEISKNVSVEKEESPNDLALRGKFGGMNPNKPFSIASIIQTIVGDFLGIPIKVGGNANSMEFLAELNRYDGKADPLGIENKNLQNLGDMGIVNQAVEALIIDRTPVPDQTSAPSAYQTPLKTTPIKGK